MVVVRVTVGARVMVGVGLVRGQSGVSVRVVVRVTLRVNTTQNPNPQP